MKKFIGTKVLWAKPMTLIEYNKYMGWNLPEDQDGDTPGYFVEYTDGGKPNHQNHEGYVSWTPADVFNNVYRPVQGLDFGVAIEALKCGHRVARAGWNGKGMWLSMSGSLSGTEVETAKFWSQHNANFARDNGGSAKVQPCITMKTAANEIQMGWLASQSDMLAEDWLVL